FESRWLPAVAVALAVAPASAQIAVSSNDNKVNLVNGVVKIVADPKPDTVAVIDLKASPPKVIGEVEAPGSVVGPPFSVAITPDESLALVTSSQKVDPADPTKTVADNRVSVIDLRAKPPAVIATLEAGKGASGVSINRQGTLALVANRNAGSISIFTIEGKTVSAAGTLALGDEKSGVSHVAISPDGKTALATRDGDDRISVLSIDGTKVEYTKRDIYAGLRPYGVDISSDGKVAVVANIGKGGGDIDTVSVIDLESKPPRVVETTTVGGQTPEGIKISPDGKLVGVVVVNGSNKAKEFPFYNDGGKLVLFKVAGKSLKKIAEAPIGHWSQGVLFTPDSKTILVGNMVEKNLTVFRFDGSKLRQTGSIPVKGGPVAVRLADKPVAVRLADNPKQ
ncbi:MAG: YncE family protein, partial [Myxococcales bacterium]